MGVSGNSVAGKSFQMFTVSEELLAKVTEAVQAGEKEARSSGTTQSLEVFCHGFRQNISLGRVYIVPPAVCNDRKDFPTSLLHGALIRVFGWGGEEIADLIEKRIGESEFDEYSQADFDTIKKDLFVDPRTGKEACLIVFAPNWTNTREWITFHFTKDANELKNNLRHQVFSAYYDPRVSSAFNAMMTNVNTTKVDVTDITPKIPFPALAENPLKQYPLLVKQAANNKPTILLNHKTADAVTKETLDPQELDVFDSLNQALEQSLLPDVRDAESAGEGGYSKPDDGGVPRAASADDDPQDFLDKMEGRGSKKKPDQDEQEKHMSSEEKTAEIMLPKGFVPHDKGNAGQAPMFQPLTGSKRVAAFEKAAVSIETRVSDKNKSNIIEEVVKKLNVRFAELKSKNPKGFMDSFDAQLPSFMMDIAQEMGLEVSGDGDTYIFTDEAGKAYKDVPVDYDKDGTLTVGGDTPGVSQSRIDKHMGSDENPLAAHESPFTNVGPGTEAHDAQKDMVPAMKESVETEKASEEAGGPIGIAIDETGIARRKEEEKKANAKDNPKTNKHDVSHPETLRVGKERLSSEVSKVFNGGFVRKDWVPGTVAGYLDKELGDNNAYAPHAAADHQKMIEAGAYGETPFDRRAQVKWGSAKTAATYSAADTVLLSYIETALWSTNDNSTPQGGEPLDKNYGREDLAPSAMTAMRRDVDKFQTDNAQLIEQAIAEDGATEARIGHDFWLTRNGHGAGFWDGDYSVTGEALTRASKAFGEVDLYLGDDHKLYQAGDENLPDSGHAIASRVAFAMGKIVDSDGGYEAMSTKAKQARAKNESLLNKFRPKTAVELDIDSIWDAITEDMGPAPLVDVDSSAPSQNSDGHSDEAPEGNESFSGGRPNKRDVADLPEAMRSDKPEDDKAIEDSTAEKQETELENAPTKEEEHHEAPTQEEDHHEGSWRIDSKFADFVEEVADEYDEDEGRQRLSCDQCQMLQINGVPCHETGCPNMGSRWDEDSQTWIKQRTCRECGNDVDADDMCCDAPFEEDDNQITTFGEQEASGEMAGADYHGDNNAGLFKEGTGEMSQSEADDAEAWPMHHAIARALGGKVKAFDQYQGPYVLIGSEARGSGVYAPAIPMKGTVRLWIQEAEGGRGLQVYNEDNEKLSKPFMYEDTQGAVQAASEVLDKPKPGKGRKGSDSKKADTADNPYNMQNDGAGAPDNKKNVQKADTTGPTPVNTKQAGSPNEDAAEGCKHVWKADGTCACGARGGPKKEKKAEWKGWNDQMPVQVVSDNGSGEDFPNLAAAKLKYPTLDPLKNTGDFTWAMRGQIGGKDAIRFESWEANRMFSASAKKGNDVSGDFSEAKSETVSPDTVDKDIQQPTVSVEEAGKHAADISGDMSEAKSETDYNKSEMADEPKATDTVNPAHFASKGECTECGKQRSLDSNGLCSACHRIEKENQGAKSSCRHDDVPVAQGEAADDKQPKSDLSGAAPEAHEVPPQVDSKQAAYGDQMPEEVEFDFGAGDLADIVMTEDTDESEA